MLRTCPSVRAVAQSTRAAVANPSNRSFSSSPPNQDRSRQPRARKPSTPAEWAAFRRVLREDPLEGRAEPPQLPPISDTLVPRPEFLKISNPTAFSHPSLASYKPRAGETREETVRRKGRWVSTFERHEMLGGDLLQFVVKELLVEKYHNLRPAAIQAATDRLLGTDALSLLADNYNLVASLRADPVAVEAIADDPEVHASLFRSYVAGMHFQYGLFATRTWIRQCFRSVINHDYADWRTAADHAEKQEAIDTPLQRLNTLCLRRRKNAQWAVTSKGEGLGAVFKADLQVGSIRTSGSGRSVHLAKQNAAILALKLADPKPPPEPEPEIDCTSRLHAYAKHRGLAPPVFFTLVVSHPVYECRLTFDGQTYIARGAGKVHARQKAAATVFEALGVDPKDVPLEVAKAPRSSSAKESGASGSSDVQPIATEAEGR